MITDRATASDHGTTSKEEIYTSYKLNMATRAMAQDIMLCDMCETSPVQMHCNSCAVNMCNDCVIKHVLIDTENGHHVVSYNKKNTNPVFPTCKTHKEQNCEMKCRQCDTQVCVQCIASGSHIQHNILDLLELVNSKKDAMKQKTTELETCTYPKFEKAVSELEIQLQNLPHTYEKLMSEISSQGEEWHREVDIVINQRKQEAEKMKSDDLASLTKTLEEMKSLLSTLHQAIKDNNELLKSNNVAQVLDSNYTSPEMWNPPPSIHITPPTFTPLPIIQGEQLHQMFGTLTSASMPGPVSSTKLVEDKFATAVKLLQLLDSPESSSSILTEYQYLHNITCLNPDEVWVSGSNNKIKRVTIPGSLQETVNTRTGNIRLGITVNRQGDLIYTDYYDRSINRVRHGKIEKIISLQDWYPLKVCTTASNDLLVIMNKSSMPNRVVRYSGSIEKQVIEFDEQGKPLFSSGRYYNAIYIAENSKTDMICVSDWDTNTVVVVNQAGKLRFRYTGNLSSQKYKSFDPRGMVIDNVGHILVADCSNHCIHIIDQKGHFIRYIGNCQLNCPIDLSLDRNNTLYVAENSTAKVKVIKYLS